MPEPGHGASQEALRTLIRTLLQSHSSRRSARHFNPHVLGIGFTTFYIIGNRFFGMPAFVFGISAQGIGRAGTVLNLVTALVVSRLTPPPPAHIQAMVENVRVPRAPR